MKPTPTLFRSPTNRTRQPRVRLDTFFAHSPEKVWRALTEARKLSKWLLPTDGDIRPELGHRFDFTAPDGERIACEVVEADPGRRLAFTWEPETRADGPPSIVTWTLMPQEEGTRLLLEHDGAPEELSPLSGGTLRLTACLAGAGMSAPVRRFRGLRAAARPGIICRSYRAANARRPSYQEVSRCL